MFKHEPCVSSACMGDHCKCGFDWPCKKVEKAIHSQYYDSMWEYMNHAGYNKERDDAAYAKFREGKLAEIVGNLAV